MKRKTNIMKAQQEKLNALYCWERGAIQYIQDEDLIARWNYLLDKTTNTPFILRHAPEFQQKIAQLAAIRDELQARGYGADQ